MISPKAIALRRGFLSWMVLALLGFSFLAPLPEAQGGAGGTRAGGSAARDGGGTRGGGDIIQARARALEERFFSSILSEIRWVVGAALVNRSDYSIRRLPPEIARIYEAFRNENVLRDIRRESYFVADFNQCIDSKGIARAATATMHDSGEKICLDFEKMIRDGSSDAEIVGLVLHEHAHPYGFLDENYAFMNEVIRFYGDLSAQRDYFYKKRLYDRMPLITDAGILEVSHRIHARFGVRIQMADRRCSMTTWDPIRKTWKPRDAAEAQEELLKSVEARLIQSNTSRRIFPEGADITVEYHPFLSACEGLFLLITPIRSALNYTNRILANTRVSAARNRSGELEGFTLVADGHNFKNFRENSAAAIVALVQSMPEENSEAAKEQEALARLIQAKNAELWNAGVHVCRRWFLCGHVNANSLPFENRRDILNDLVWLQHEFLQGKIAPNIQERRDLPSEELPLYYKPAQILLEEAMLRAEAIR